MIYDCFPFFNELDLLEIRLEELWNVVDKFVISESITTHRGASKNLYYLRNKKRYEKYQDKIIYLEVRNLPRSDQPWIAENMQRNYFRNILRYKDDDIFLISDADEIPKASTLQCIDLHKNKFYKLSMSMHYYYVNYVSVKSWGGAIIVDGTTLRREIPSTLRWGRKNKGITIGDCGWHFSFLGTPEQIRKKIKSYAHKEYDDDQIHNDKHITSCIKNGKDIFGRGLEFHLNNELQLPKYLVDNKDKFSHLFYKKDDTCPAS